MTVEEAMKWSNPKRKLVMRSRSSGGCAQSEARKLMIGKNRPVDLTSTGYTRSLKGGRLIEEKSAEVSLRDRARIFNTDV